MNLTNKRVVVMVNRVPGSRIVMKEFTFNFNVSFDVSSYQGMYLFVHTRVKEIRTWNFNSAKLKLLVYKLYKQKIQTLLITYFFIIYTFNHNTKSTPITFLNLHLRYHPRHVFLETKKKRYQLFLLEPKEVCK